MNDNYYVYEIIIEGKVRYVGISQQHSQKFDKTHPKHWVRLGAHGMFMSPLAASKRIRENRIGRFKHEILEAISENKECFFVIIKDGLDGSEAGKLEQRLISKYVPCMTVFGGKQFGQLINKYSSPRTIVKNVKGKFDAALEKSVNGSKKWWESLTPEERSQMSRQRSQRIKEEKERDPEGYKSRMAKFHTAGRRATSKEYRTEETRLKQSNAFKKRWQQGEPWMEAKREQSRQFMQRLSASKEFKERSRNQCLERNKNPEWQLEKVARLFLTMKNNGKIISKWKESYKQLVEEGKYPRKSFRDWKKYFNSMDELLNYVKIYESKINKNQQ